MDEKEAIIETMWLQFGCAANLEPVRFPRALQLESAPVLLYAPRAPKVTAPVRPLGASLPPNVWVDLFVRHSLNMDDGAAAAAATAAPAEYSLRLQNVVVGSEPATVSLSALGMTMQTCKETTMTYEMGRNENSAVRLVWKAQGENATEPASSAVADSDACDASSQVVLAPLDIRTFVVTV